jgi:hypothetical protein
MNCKPGDMAVVVRIPSPEAERNLGMLVRVVRAAPSLSTLDSYRDWWMCEALSPFIGWRSGVRLDVPAGTECAVPDAVLKPLQDPGDDAVDEMVLKLGAAPKVKLPETEDVS